MTQIKAYKEAADAGIEIAETYHSIDLEQLVIGRSKDDYELAVMLLDSVARMQQVDETVSNQVITPPVVEFLVSLLRS